MTRNFGISRQAIQQTLEEVEQEGLVSLETDPKDGRAKIVRFGPRGRGIGKAALSTMAVLEAVLKRRIGAKALEQLQEERLGTRL